MAVGELALHSRVETFDARSRALAVQRLRSLAMSDPQAIADVIARWLADDPSGWRRPTPWRFARP